MDLKEIISVTGKPGLFKTVAQTKTGVIIESLTDGKRMQVFATDKLSSLGEINLLTTGKEMPLFRMFTLMREKYADQPAPSPKATDAELKAYVESVLPDYDREKLYVSHMRKLCAWYNQLVEHGITEYTGTDLSALEEDADKEAETAAEEAADAKEEK